MHLNNHHRLVSAAAVATVAVIGSAAAVVPTASAGTATKAGSKSALMLAVQSESSTLTTAANGRYTLTMTGTDPSMAVFSDRPVRRGGVADTGSLVPVWKKGGKTSFKSDPPNAAVTVHEADGTMDVLLVTLSKPQYDQATKTLTFTARPLSKKTPVPATAVGVNLGATSVFIDSTTPACDIECVLDGSM